MSGAQNQIDLSQLPPPNVIEVVTYAQVLASMKAALLALIPTYDVENEADPAVKILEIAAYRETLLRERINNSARSLMLAYATGSDLDHLGSNLRLTRFTGETDSAFRSRIQLAPDGYSVAGPEAAYIYHARAAHPDVADATATSPAAGQVLVSVLSKLSNGAASQAIIDAVNLAVNDKTVRPLTDQVTVGSATIINYTVAATLYFFSGPDAALVLTTVTSRLGDYITAQRRIGRDITRSGIIAALHADGVQNVVLTTPATDIAINNTSCAHCTNITLTNGGVAE